MIKSCRAALVSANYDERWQFGNDYWLLICTSPTLNGRIRLVCIEWCPCVNLGGVLVEQSVVEERKLEQC